jgi:hypothetical protein
LKYKDDFYIPESVFNTNITPPSRGVILEHKSVFQRLSREALPQKTKSRFPSRDISALFW